MDLIHRVDYYLEPGYIYFSTTPAVVRTVVGSCVAVCLWDRELKYGGMNHFLHPATRDAGQTAPRCDNVAWRPPRPCARRSTGCYGPADTCLSATRKVSRT